MRITLAPFVSMAIATGNQIRNHNTSRFPQDRLLRSGQRVETNPTTPRRHIIRAGIHSRTPGAAPIKVRRPIEGVCFPKEPASES